MEGRSRTHIGKRRDTGLVAEQRLRRHDHQRLAEIPPQLAPQHMEIVCRRGAVHDLHVVLGAELQIALEAGRGMFRSLPLISVREQQHQRVHAKPFRLAGGNELVDDDLRAVREITELRLPHHQRVRLDLRESVFESHDGSFRQRRVDDLENGLFRIEMGKRRVTLLIRLVDKNGMALAEGSAAGILSRKTHRITLEEKRSEGKMLGRRPVKTLTVPDPCRPRLDDACQLGIQGHMLGDRRHRFADPAKRVEVDRRFAAALHAVRGTHAGPASLKPVGLVRAIARAGLEFGVEIGDPLVDDGLRLFLADDALGNQLVGIDRAGRLVLADGLVHQGLREHRFVALIMPEPPVAEHVEHDVGAEGLAEFDRDPCCMYDGFRIVSIDVEDRRHDHFRNIGRIGRGPRIMRARGETDLVVHDDVDGTTGAIAAER